MTVWVVADDPINAVKMKNNTFASSTLLPAKQGSQNTSNDLPSDLASDGVSGAFRGGAEKIACLFAPVGGLLFLGESLLLFLFSCSGFFFQDFIRRFAIDGFLIVSIQNGFPDDFRSFIRGQGRQATVGRADIRPFHHGGRPLF